MTKPIQLTLTFLEGQEDPCARALYAAVPLNLRKSLGAFAAALVQEYEAANRGTRILVADVASDHVERAIREFAR